VTLKGNLRKQVVENFKKELEQLINKYNIDTKETHDWSSPNKTNVVQLPVLTRLDLNSDMLLKSLVGKLDSFVLAGWDKDGNEFFSTSIADGGDVLWLIERLKLSLLN
jgi:hypothetical protein